MKKLLVLTAAIIGLGLLPAFAQFGPRSGGPRFDGAMNKLFGANQAFSANVEFQISGGNGGDNITMPSKVNFDAGKTRFEMNMSEMKGSKMPANIMDHMKSMGMDTIISIARPDLKLTYVVYPGLNSYAEMAGQDPTAGASLDDFKVETTELGKETVEGHDCVKNKVTVTDKDGAKHESTVWNATDLKQFPIKIVTTDNGPASTILFKDVTFTKPAANLFEAPAGFTKYTDVQVMMQTEMAKKMGNMGMAPQHQ
jgi:hypothetical protein